MLAVCNHCGGEFEQSPSQIKNYDYRCNKCRYRLSQKKCGVNYLKKKPWWKHLDGLRGRCNYAKGDSYRYYGARGIKAFITAEEIESLWHRDKASLMNKPSIDRIDSDGDYTVDNCRFIEMKDNRRRYGKKALHIRTNDRNPQSQRTCI